MNAPIQLRDISAEIPEARPDGTCYQCGARALFFDADDGCIVCLLCGRVQVLPGAAANERG